MLDLSSNDLKGFSLLLPALRELHLSGNKFLILPSGWLFPNLQTLMIQVRPNQISSSSLLHIFSAWSLFALLQSNTLNMFGPSDLESYQRLESLQAGQNKFFCSCDFVDFIQSGIKGGVVHLTDSEESYICDSPLHLQGEPVGRVHLSIMECHLVLTVSVICVAVLIVIILVFVLLWRLHAIWYLKMMWAWLKAKRSSRKRRRQYRDADGTEPLLSFDAFVSYSERDASWVENFLIPELEGPRWRQFFIFF